MRNHKTAVIVDYGCRRPLWSRVLTTRESPSIALIMRGQSLRIAQRSVSASLKSLKRRDATRLGDPARAARRTSFIRPRGGATLLVGECDEREASSNNTGAWFFKRERVYVTQVNFFELGGFSRSSQSLFFRTKSATSPSSPRHPRLLDPPRGQLADVWLVN